MLEPATVAIENFLLRTPSGAMIASAELGKRRSLVETPGIVDTIDMSRFESPLFDWEPDIVFARI